MSNKKYEFTGVERNGLRRIRRLSDGMVGGYIESAKNLAQDGTCWVSGNARVYGNARVSQQMGVQFGHVISDLSRSKRDSLRAQLNVTPFKNTIILYKRVHADLTSEYDKAFQYPSHGMVEILNVDESNASCATGLHFAGAEYYSQNDKSDSVILVARINLDDIITIQQGKVRCRRAFICGVAD
jgi:hypothetical protein